MSPVAPYAFTSTPILMNNGNPLRQHPTIPHLRQENRTSSAPVVPYSQQTTTNNTNASRQRQATPSPTSANFSAASPVYPSQQGVTKDDFAMSAPRNQQSIPRPLSSIELSSTMPDLKVPVFPNPSKQSPDRYRRGNRRTETTPSAATGQNSGGSALPSGSGMATVGHLYSHPIQPQQQQTYRGSPSSTGPDNSFLSQPRLASKDDMTLRRQNSSELAKRYRRRSVSSLEAGEFTGNPSVSEQPENRKSPVLQRPNSSHGRHASSESTTSSRASSRPSSVSPYVDPSHPCSMTHRNLTTALI